MKLKEELESIEIFTEPIQNETIKKRVTQVLNWNIKKGTKQKYLFYAFSIIVIILNAAIVVINQMEKYDLLITIIASISSVLASIITLFNFKETWHRYRKSSEEIKTECMQFNCKCGEYKEEEGREEKFLIKIESIINEERSLWETVRFKCDKTDEDKN